MKRYLKSIVFWLLPVLTAVWFASLVFQPSTNDYRDLGWLVLFLLYPFQWLFFLIPLFFLFLAVLNWVKKGK